MADITFGLPIGTMLDDRYKVQEIIGSGGFGITYKAEDTKQGVACAIKELFPRQLAVREKDGKTVSAINKSDTHPFKQWRTSGMAGAFVYSFRSRKSSIGYA